MNKISEQGTTGKNTEKKEKVNNKNSLSKSREQPSPVPEVRSKKSVSTAPALYFKEKKKKKWCFTSPFLWNSWKIYAEISRKENLELKILNWTLNWNLELKECQPSEWLYKPHKWIQTKWDIMVREAK